ncbi:prepilin-type N-terminal cleavage/methylation domain-containing protein [Clostridium aceticum]|uniref:Prepilin-type N-terminal cleavage/methylation domain-containing protein n=1 Tax=Clostridium aceticum TaxID=84022 RepID=A0A0D8ICW0_9CLOT|nr:prepilin-type N-terminal cleavage/methylation domain-containing protein [Clostridium aceticum]AKL95275.1 prepilin-type N-terminal cleavage/methylation domain-containing protein [Clostridium aceticum]KJF28123.1 hypothetical protein TZ02_06155 [Clostridium aceticum]
MLLNYKEPISKEKQKIAGFTLLEVILATALITVILVAAYNMLFFGIFTYESVSESSLVSVEIQPVIAQIERDVRQARKPNDTQNSVVRIDGHELIVHTDITGDGKPEQIRYKIESGELKRSYRLPQGSQYPYSYSGNYSNEKVLIRNIINNDVFPMPYDPDPFNPAIHDKERKEKVTEPEHDYSPPDHRRKLNIRFVIDDSTVRGGNLEIQKFLMSRSRVEAD